MNDSAASGGDSEGTAMGDEVKQSNKAKPPVLTLAGYYGTRSLRAKTFVGNFKKSAKRSFDAEDRAEAHRLREDADAGYARTLELAVAATGAATPQIKAMILSWIAEVIRSDVGGLVPGSADGEGSAIQVFRTLTGALIAERASERSEQRAGDGGQRENRSGHAPAAGAAPPTGAPDPKLAAKKKKQRRLRRINLSLLALVYLAESRGLSIVEARPYLAEVVKTSKTARGISPSDATASLASMKPDRLGALLEVVGLWDNAINEARHEAARSRDAERKAQKETEELQRQMDGMRAEIEQLTVENTHLKTGLQETEQRALAERQRLGAQDRERRGRMFRFVSERAKQRITLIEEALQADPPAVDVALQTVQEMERDRVEEGEWLKSLE